MFNQMKQNYNIKNNMEFDIKKINPLFKET